VLQCQFRELYGRLYCKNKNNLFEKVNKTAYYIFSLDCPQDYLHCNSDVDRNSHVSITLVRFYPKALIQDLPYLGLVKTRKVAGYESRKWV
jgi:hypothetical protein